MTLEDLFPTDIVHGLQRIGIWSVNQLRDHLPELGQIAGHHRYGRIGKARRELIEYVMFVELP